MPDPVTPGTLLNRERLGLIGLLVVLIALGAFVEWRSARERHKRTDLGVYLRAAWAVRSGQNIYTITDNNGWHYHYPPLLAILLTPMADPSDAPLHEPLNTLGVWTIPWAVSVGLWYVLSVYALWLAVDLIAGAATDMLRGPPPQGLLWSAIDPSQSPRFWWLLRASVILFCLPAVARGMVRGQVGTFQLLLIAGMAAALIRGWSFRAGLWLAGAICLKIIPAFLLLVFLWRRDWRALCGCAIGLLIGLVIIPGFVLGPQQTLDSYVAIYREVLQPSLEGGENRNLEAPSSAASKPGDRGRELTNINATDSNSPMTVLHNLSHLSTPRAWRPTEALPWIKWTHLLIGVGLTIVTLQAAGWRKSKAFNDPLSILLFVSALTLIHVLLSPVSHPHYLTLAVLPVMALLLTAWTHMPFPRLSAGWQQLLWSTAVIHVLTVLPGLEILREIGLVLWGGLALWLACVVQLHRRRHMIAESSDQCF